MNQDILSLLGADRLIHSVESFLTESGSFLPAELGISSFVQLAILLIFGTVILGFVFRIFFGKHCNANKAISVSAGILFIYAVTIAVYALNPLDLSKYLSPLPFALFRRDILILVPFSGTAFSLIAAHILSLVILCFIVHFLDFLLPTGRSFFSWLFFRCLSIGLAIFLNLAVNLAINTFLPQGLAAYAPMVLLIVLGAALLIGLFNPLLCILFTIANPVIGLLYTFFFSTTIGKQLTKAVISTVILCLLFFAMEIMGYSVIDITSTAVIGYLPFCGILLLIWYLFDCIL